MKGLATIIMSIADNTMIPVSMIKNIIEVKKFRFPTVRRM
ncbi:hypothetical protein NMS_0087 [Nonlabens marinus S1-08]|uniref:Uncharacterized protein n=1 Tax=Nonlabens marinus S1-08 TaxID=1454201 RepID=W8VZ77_9FLAO|nr:hypothetical protein NMS_0087 [Nonlabens marinus S1-08]